MTQPTDEQIVTWLQELQPLQKVHYSWPVYSGLFDNPGDARLYEYARITNAISLQAYSVTAAQVQIAVDVCNAVNLTNPVIPCSIAINYSPWHHKFDLTLPPTDTGPTHDEEVQRFKDKLNSFKDNLAAANLASGLDIQLTAVLFDSEVFVVDNSGTVDATIHNNAIDQKHDVIFSASKVIFPDVEIIQYLRGGMVISASTDGWSQAQYHTLNEAGESFSAELYRPAEIGTLREEYRRTVENADLHAVYNVIPWLSVGSGYRRQVDQFRKWESWDYDLIYSWQLGAEINIPWYGDRPDRFAPWHRASSVVFFSTPWHTTKYPAWPKHFVAYVRGANNIKTLPE